MIKRTVSIENPARLSMKNGQMIVERDGAEPASIPIEDLGVLIIDNPGVMYTNACMTALMENNTAVILSGRDHHPAGLLLPLNTNSLQSERFRDQINAGAPLKKQLWRQTVRQKILNQAGLLKNAGAEGSRLTALARGVRSGDAGNHEAQAARYYWRRLLGEGFKRERFGGPPNNLLNYGYMVIRAATARALLCSGLLPTIGIHHHNRYNAYCLADDIMEPYRVFVDRAVIKAVKDYGECRTLTKEIKQSLLNVLVCDVRFKEKTSPLMVGLQSTTASLQRCFSGEERNIDYPGL